MVIATLNSLLFETQNVIDLWGGYKDKTRTTPWDKDTIVNVFSTTKTVSSLAMLVLIDRGLIDPDENVCKYWPEFAANGKENVKVRHIMSHTSGLSGWETPINHQDLYNFEKLATLLANQAPWWQPGDASGYHAMTFGFLLGEVVRRVTGKSLRQFIQDEIAKPLGADFQIGAEEKDWQRIADLETKSMDNPESVLPGGNDASQAPPMAQKTFAYPGTNGLTKQIGTSAWRNADIGAANGHSNARGVNRVLSPIALGGEVDGVRLLSQATIDRIFETQADGVDLALGLPARFGIGFGLSGSPVLTDLLPPGKVYFWGGWGGSLAVIDVERRTTVTYAMNKMYPGILGTPPLKKYMRAIYAALGVELAPSM